MSPWHQLRKLNPKVGRFWVIYALVGLILLSPLPKILRVSWLRFRPPISSPSHLSIPAESRVIQLSSTQMFTCALFENGGVKCWGYNENGQLGLGHNKNMGIKRRQLGSNLPYLDFGKGVRVTKLASGPTAAHMCAILSNQTFRCWGPSSGGRLGLSGHLGIGAQPEQMGTALPVPQVYSKSAPVEVVVGGTFTCTRFADTIVKCFGNGESGQTGLGDREARKDFTTDVPSLDLGEGLQVTQLAAGTATACAVSTDHHVKCWGDNRNGQLGIPNFYRYGDIPDTMGDRLGYANLGFDVLVEQVGVGDGFACAVTVDQRIKCWGANDSGQLGLGDTRSRGGAERDLELALPFVDLGAGLKALKISVGASHVCALLSDSKQNTQLKCWGGNQFGQLGLGDNRNRGSRPGELGDNLPPLNFGSKRQVISVSAGGHHTCVLLNDGSVTCFGYNAFGQLAVGDKDPRGDSPLSMPPFTSPAALQ